MLNKLVAYVVCICFLIISIDTFSKEISNISDPNNIEIDQSKKEQNIKENSIQKSNINNSDQFENEIIQKKFDQQPYENISFHLFNNNPTKEIIIDIESMLTGKTEEGVYEDNRVLEAISELLKTNKRIIISEIEKKNEEIEKTMNSVINSYKNSKTKINSKYFENEVLLLEKLNKKTALLSDINSNINQWKNIIKQINQIKGEKKALIQIYKERLKLLSHSYLICTYAYHTNDSKNNEYITQYSYDLVKKELGEKILASYIAETIALTNDTLSEVVIQETRKFQIQKSFFDGIDISIYGKRALIQKYKLFIEPELKTTKSQNESLPEKIRARSYIVIGLKDVFETSNDNINNQKNQSFKELIYSKYKEFCDFSYLTFEIKVKKYEKKIIQFIEEVINDNLFMINRYSILNKEFNEELDKKNIRISSLKQRIKDINGNLVKIMGFNEENRIILSDEITEYKQLEKNKIYMTYIDKLNHDIKSIEDRYKKHRKNKKIIAFTVIKKFGKYNDKKNYNYGQVFPTLTDSIKEKYKSMIEAVCPSSNNKNIAENDKERIPIPLGYSIPNMSISLKEEEDIEKSFIIPIALTVNCQELIVTFDYDIENNEIIDLKTKTRWEIVKNNQMPRRRFNINDKYSYSNFSEYLDFCEGYENYIKDKMISPYFNNWPHIKCVKRFIYDKYEGIIIDYVRGEKWKIINQEKTYSNVQSMIRGTNWQLYSYERLERFFDELLKAYHQDEIDKEVFLMFTINNNAGEKKQFWTGSREGVEVSTIVFDGKSINKEYIHKKEKVFGLITRTLNTD